MWPTMVMLRLAAGAGGVDHIGQHRQILGLQGPGIEVEIDREITAGSGRRRRGRRHGGRRHRGRHGSRRGHGRGRPGRRLQPDKRGIQRGLAGLRGRGGARHGAVEHPAVVIGLGAGGLFGELVLAGGDRRAPGGRGWWSEAGPGPASGSGSVPALARSALAAEGLGQQVAGRCRCCREGVDGSKKELSAGAAGRAAAWAERSV